MEALKNMWKRIIVAFAQPADGKGASGTRGADPQSEEAQRQNEAAETGQHTWKAHGGVRK